MIYICMGRRCQLGMNFENIPTNLSENTKLLILNSLRIKFILTIHNPELCVCRPARMVFGNLSNINYIMFVM